MPDTKVTCMKESNIVVSIAINNLVQRVISQNTKRIIIKTVNQFKINVSEDR